MAAGWRRLLALVPAALPRLHPSPPPSLRPPLQQGKARLEPLPRHPGRTVQDGPHHQAGQQGQVDDDEGVGGGGGLAAGGGERLGVGGRHVQGQEAGQRWRGPRCTGEGLPRREPGGWREAGGGRRGWRSRAAAGRPAAARRPAPARPALPRPLTARQSAGAPRWCARRWRRAARGPPWTRRRPAACWRWRAPGCGPSRAEG